MRHDLNQLRQEVDLELILQYYGYRLNTKKSNQPNTWRLYEIGQGKDKHRLAVRRNEQGLKFFVDLNDSQFSGDIFKFMERMEQGNYHTIFKIIDLIKSRVEMSENRKSHEQINDLIHHSIKENLRREKELCTKYSILPLDNTVFLEGRGIEKKVIFANEFNGCIKNITLFFNNIKHINTAFLMFASDGKMISIDIRNTTFKAFPEGGRGEALWISNPFFRAKKNIKIVGNEEIKEGTIGTINSITTQNIFFTFGKLGEEKRVNLFKIQIENAFQKLPFHRIVISESAIDAISLKQLSPEQPDERRLYLATCGQPSGKQIRFLQKILNQNPQAQLVIAQDNDPAGLRFAINYLGLIHPCENPYFKIKPIVTYSFITNNIEINSVENHTLTGVNRLSLELCYPLALGARKAQGENEGFVEKMNLLVKEYGINSNNGLNYDETNGNSKIEVETILDENMKFMITRSTIYFPNITNLLAQILDCITNEIEKRQGQKLFHILCSSPPSKDLNELLQIQKGEELPALHPLKLPALPIIKPYHELQISNEDSTKKINKQGFEGETNTIDF
jgi:hypothetical protein